MRKNRLVKFIVLALVVVTAVIVCSLAVMGAGENKTYNINYYSNGKLAKTEKVAAGTVKYTILKNQLSSAQQGKTFYGWYGETGEFYGSILTNIESDYNLYEAYGVEVATKEEFIAAASKPGTYIQLADHLIIDEVVTLPSSGSITINLNGFRMTVRGEDVAFVGKNPTVHIMNTGTASTSRIAHTGVATNPNLMDAALFTFEPNPTANVEIRVFKNATVESNVGLFDIVSEMTYSKYTYNFLIDGNLKGNFLVRSYGIKDATFKMSSTARLDVLGQYAFEDRGNYDGINMTFDMPGGKLNIEANTFITNELSKYNVYLTGGTYNRSLSHLYPNYTFKQSGTSYTVTACAHNDILVNMTASCTEAGTITYRCSLCGSVRTLNSAATGHSLTKSLAQEAIATVEKTEPGYYSTTCQRCDYEERDYFYPAPKDVHVTVKYRLTTGEDRVIRVPATALYVFDNDTLRLKTFATSYVESQYGIKQSQIYSVEIPLGIKTIAGGISNAQTGYTPQGVFYGNTHLEEIVLPMSLQNIEATAFADMKSLKNVVGLENVTGTIGERAFEQTKGNIVIIERMYLNASSIGSRAFYNFTMTSLTLGVGVKSISSNAFGMTDIEQSTIHEIFVDGNTTVDGKKLSEYGNGRFSSVGSGHQFDGMAIVFLDHNFEVETTAPTCKEKGYDFMKCKYCGEEKIDNYVDTIDHIREEVKVPTTCVGQGYEGNKCTMCGDIEVTLWYVGHEPEHDYTYTTTNSRENICEDDYEIKGTCICGATDPNWENWTFVEATGEHVWDEYNYLEYVEPTCSEEGYKLFNCIHCGYEVSYSYPATGKHIFSTDFKNTIPSTCKTEGKRIFVCDVCSEVKEIKDVLNPDNHEWEKDAKGNLVWTTKVAATAEKAGTAQNKCVGCGKTQTKGIPVTGEQTKKADTLYLILIIAGGVLVLAGLGITLYFTVFKKSASAGYKYKFNTLGKK